MDLINLISICVIVFFGVVLHKTRFINNVFVEKTIDLMHFILLPIVIFWTIVESKNSVVFGWDIFSALLPAFLVFIFSLLYIYFFKIERAKAPVFSMNCYRPNIYLGLSLIYYLFDRNVFNRFCVILFMIILMADVMTSIGNLWISKEKKQAEAVQFFRRLFFSNPAVIAGVLGILFLKLDFHLPVFLANTFDFIFPTMFPLTLILTGAMLSQIRVKNFSMVIITASFLKTIILPFSGWLLFSFFWPDSDMFVPMILFLSLPYLLDRKIASATERIQREVMMPYYFMSALFFFIGFSVFYYFFQ